MKNNSLFLTSNKYVFLKNDNISNSFIFNDINVKLKNKITLHSNRSVINFNYINIFKNKITFTNKVNKIIFNKYYIFTQKSISN